MLCTQTPGGISEDEYVESLLDHGVAGIIFVSGRHADTAADHQRYQKLIDRKLPLVFVNGYAPDLAAPFISDDDVEAMNLAVTHLDTSNTAASAWPSGRSGSCRCSASGRIRGGARPAARHPEDEALGWIAQSLFTLEGGAAAASRLLAQGATAIVCGSDLMALGAIQAVRRARASASPATSRSWATTTARSSPSSTRR